MFSRSQVSRRQLPRLRLGSAAKARRRRGQAGLSARGTEAAKQSRAPPPRKRSASGSCWKAVHSERKETPEAAGSHHCNRAHHFGLSFLLLARAGAAHWSCCMVASLNFLVSLLRWWRTMGRSMSCFHMSYAVQCSEPRANICGRRRARSAGRRTCFAARATEDGLFDRWIEHAVLAWKLSHRRHLRMSSWNIPAGGAPEAAGGV